MQTADFEPAIPASERSKAHTLDRAATSASFLCKGKSKAVPLQAWSGPECSRKLRFPDYVTTAQDGGKDVQPYAPAAYSPRRCSCTHFC